MDAEVDAQFDLPVLDSTLVAADMIAGAQRQLLDDATLAKVLDITATRLQDLDTDTRCGFAHHRSFLTDGEEIDLCEESIRNHSAFCAHSGHDAVEDAISILSRQELLGESELQALRYYSNRATIILTGADTAAGNVEDVVNLMRSGQVVHPYLVEMVEDLFTPAELSEGISTERAIEEQQRLHEEGSLVMGELVDVMQEVVSAVQEGATHAERREAACRVSRERFPDIQRSIENTVFT